MVTVGQGWGWRVPMGFCGSGGARWESPCGAVGPSGVFGGAPWVPVGLGGGRSGLRWVAACPCPPPPPGPLEKRRIRLSPGAALNIYLVLDASQSIGPEDFGDARNALRELVEKVAPPDPPVRLPRPPKSPPWTPLAPPPIPQVPPNPPDPPHHLPPPQIASYGAAPHYGIITFGTEARVVLSPMEPQAADGASVDKILEELAFAGGGGGGAVLGWGS